MSTATALPLDQHVLEQIVKGEHDDPHSVLGAHVHAGAVTVRVLRPLADSVTVVYDGGSVPLEHEHGGIWVGVLPGAGMPAFANLSPAESTNLIAFLRTLRPRAGTGPQRTTVMLADAKP